jgi:hypothetical protein
MFLPRVGQEVVVDLLEGDPDRPIITGRVYNAEHMFRRLDTAFEPARQRRRSWFFRPSEARSSPGLQQASCKGERSSPGLHQASCEGERSSPGLHQASCKGERSSPPPSVLWDPYKNFKFRSSSRPSVFYDPWKNFKKEVRRGYLVGRFYDRI